MKKTIAIIEDDRIARESIKDILEIEGYNVLTAKDGVEGYRIIKEYIPDLILCDISMPKLNGYQLYEQLQTKSSLFVIPFIFLTAKARKEDIKTGLRLGVDDYVTKPLDYDELLGTISRRLNKRALIINETEERFKIFYENTLTGIFILEKDKIVFANPKFYSIIGYEVDDLNNEELLNIIDLKNRTDFIQNINNCYKGIDKNFFSELNIISKDKQLKRVQIFAGISTKNGKKVIVGLLMKSHYESINNKEKIVVDDLKITNKQIKITENINNKQIVCIQLAGDLSIKNTQNIKENIIPVLNKYSIFEINLINVENIDLTFLQLLYSIKKKIEKDKKKIIFNTEIPDDMKMLIELSDFYEILK
ncbi:MAG: hypothetical protein A2X12_10310 [Bacteroidetes bacterium GWE2_29_8]|nr:MAG: hypothetical protein A2X12_10310 [Bacteroidetes bacterium GWE2_29_8]OFY17406.1 MAG: hypothetical protein A2X02_00730 [Bacteroidetes bacterium GWF2_29_10]